MWTSAKASPQAQAEDSRYQEHILQELHQTGAPVSQPAVEADRIDTRMQMAHTPQINQ